MSKKILGVGARTTASFSTIRNFYHHTKRRLSNQGEINIFLRRLWIDRRHIKRSDRAHIISWIEYSTNSLVTRGGVAMNGLFRLSEAL